MQSIKWIYVLLNCAEGEKLMCTKYELVNNRTKGGGHLHNKNMWILNNKFQVIVLCICVVYLQDFCLQQSIFTLQYCCT